MFNMYTKSYFKVRVVFVYVLIRVCACVCVRVGREGGGMTRTTLRYITVSQLVSLSTLGLISSWSCLAQQISAANEMRVCLTVIKEAFGTYDF